MLQKIEARTFATYLMGERAEAKDGKATLFWVRRLSHREGIEWELRQAKAIEDCKSLDPGNQARVLQENVCGMFAAVVEKIEKYGDGTGEPIEDPVKIRQFAIDYLTYEQTNEICMRAKTGFLLAETDKEIAGNG